jgi:hypothetical protein
MTPGPTRKPSSSARRRPQAGGERVYELSLITGPSLLEMLSGMDERAEADDALRAVADVLSKLSRWPQSGEKPFSCAACDHASERDLPPVVILAKPFVCRRGHAIVGAICAACETRGRDAVTADIMAQLRANGTPDPRTIEMGSA